MWVYICHVSDVHRPNVLIVKSLYTIIFSAITPPAWSECVPVMSGSIHLSCSLSFFDVVLTALKFSPLVTSVHDSLRQTSQRRLSSVNFSQDVVYPAC